MTKDEAIAWFKSFMNEIDTQDNLGTGKPIQYLLQQKREYVAEAGYGDTRMQYMHPESEGRSFDTLEECIESLVDSGYSGENLQDEVDKIKEIDIGHYWQTAQSFFTKRGYEDHYAINGHNLGEHRYYVVHAFRNPENRQLFEAIRAIIEEDK